MQTRPARRARTRSGRLYSAVGIAAAVILLTVGLFNWESGSGAAFGQVLERFSKVQVVSYVQTIQAPGMPETKVKTIYKSPGLMRQEWPAGMLGIVDLQQKKMMMIMPSTKQYIINDMTNAPVTQDPTKMDMVGNLQKLAADSGTAIGEKTLEGRRVRGFRASFAGSNLEIWADAATGDLVQVEQTIATVPDVKSIMTEIRTDEPVDDTMFELRPPDGYSLMNVQMNMSAPTEEHLVGLLRFWVTMSADETFLPAINQSEIMKAAASGKMKKGQLQGMDSKEKMMEKTHELTKGFLFVTMMKPENDWHYAGAGIKMGDAAKPVCWWKPAGSATYRVIYGDLSIKDVAADQLPTAGAAK